MDGRKVENSVGQQAIKDSHAVNACSDGSTSCSASATAAGDAGVRVNGGLAIVEDEAAGSTRNLASCGTIWDNHCPRRLPAVVLTSPIIWMQEYS
jgi:hypothetical protein